MFFLATLVPILPLASSTSVTNLTSPTSSFHNLILPPSPSLAYSSLPGIQPEIQNLNANELILLNSSLLANDSLNIISSFDPPEYAKGNLTLSKTDQTLEHIIAIVVPILFSLIFIIGLFGNALVVIVVTMNASMRSTTNLLILNLAIADLLFIVFCVPFTASDYYFTNWQFGQLWCKVVQYLILVLACASNYTLVLMSVDRYLAVVHPISSMSIRTARNAYYAIILIWVLITLACLPAIQLHTTVSYGDSNDKFLSCTFNSTINITHTQFQLGFCVSSYVIPLLIAFSLYFLMLKKLWFGSSTVSSQSRLNNIRCRKRVTRMVIIVVLTFAFCWSPIQIILVLKSLNLYHTDNSVSIVVQIASQVLAYTNSCINPILYAFLSENFRKAFHKVIACNLVGIYGVNQASMVMQTGQTSVAPQQSAYLAPMRTNSKRNTFNRQLVTDLDNNNNNEKDQLPDIIESANRNLKSVNFSIVADGGLFPKNSQDSNDNLSRSSRSPTIDDKSGETTTLINKNDKQINPILNQSKGRFKSSAICADQDVENDTELDESKMELHPMYEFKSVPSTDFNSNTDLIAVKESTNDTINKSVNNVNNCSNCSNNPTNTATTMTTMLNNAKSNGVFL